ncbi:MAG: hypothetical protein V4561_11345 [Bacteroidota bacterium]
MKFRLLRIFLFCFFVTESLAQSSKKSVSQHMPAIGSQLPSFQILLLDGQTIVETKTINNSRPTVFLLFSPDCSHCAELSQSVIEHISAFDSVNLCMVSTPAPLKDIQAFVQANKLLDFEQITVGQDFSFFLGSYFRTDSVPFAVIYNKDKKLSVILSNLKNVEELTGNLSKLKE